MFTTFESTSCRMSGNNLSSRNNNQFYGRVSKTAPRASSKSMFSGPLRPQNNLTSASRRSAGRTRSREEIIANAPLHSEVKWVEKKRNRLIDGSDSSDEGNDGSRDKSDSEERKAVIFGSMPKTRGRKVADLLSNDSFDETPNSSKEPAKPLIDVSKLIEPSDDEGDADDSFLMSVKDFAYYERQRRQALRQGKENGWPESLDDSAMRERAQKLIPNLTSIINGEVTSYYHQEAESAMTKWLCAQTGSRDPEVHRKTFGSSKRIEAMSLEKVKQLNLPSDTGYYGLQGQEVLRNALSGPLEKCFYNIRTSPHHNELWWLLYLGFYPYMLSVIIPEALTQIVAEDRSIPINEARNVVQESTEYGLIKFPMQVSKEHNATLDEMSDFSSDDDFLKS